MSGSRVALVRTAPRTVLEDTHRVMNLAGVQDTLAKKNSKQKKIDQRGTLGFPSLKNSKSGGGVVTNNAADAMLSEDPYDVKVAIAYWSNFALYALRSFRTLGASWANEPSGITDPLAG